VGDLASLEPHLAVGGLGQAQQQAAERGLAAAALAHQTDRLGWTYLDRGVLHGAHDLRLLSRAAGQSPAAG
jgi:hypothetical protein